MLLTKNDIKLTKIFRAYYEKNNIFRPLTYILGQEKYLENTCDLVTNDLKKLGLLDYIKVEAYTQKYYKRIIYHIHIKFLSDDENEHDIVYGLLKIKGIL